MTGHAYATSAKIAKRVGPFAGYHKDREGMNKVLKMHREEVTKIDASLVPKNYSAPPPAPGTKPSSWASCYGVRNSQATVLAPTGTIGLMMDCDTTGIEPDLGLVKVKKLVGGGTMNIVNQTVPRALKALGYNRAQVEDIVNYIDVEKTIIGAPHLKDEHLPVFACSMGDNAIHYLGHVKMMGAVQPFISGAITKTVNMPEEVTVEDIEQLHIDAWKMGLKAVAIYRDNCKVAQPLSMAKKAGSELKMAPAAIAEGIAEIMVPRNAIRRELPKTRNSKIFKYTVGGVRGYAIVGEYDDGTPGELFISMAKMGSTLRGVMDSFAISVSFGLQFGVPLKNYVQNFTNTSFPPSGITDDLDIRTASSLIDYIFRRLGKTYLSFDDQLEVGLASLDDMPVDQTSLLDEVADEVAQAEQEVIREPLADQPLEVVSASTAPTSQISQKTDVAARKQPAQDPAAPLCYNCGNQTQRAGSCYVCTACGSTTGCS